MHFFLSYSAPAGNNYEKIFFDLLVEEIQRLGVRLPPEQIGYMDTHNQEGDNWQKRIIDALEDAPVLVCLSSPSYAAYTSSAGAFPGESFRRTAGRVAWCVDEQAPE